MSALNEIDVITLPMDEYIKRYNDLCDWYERNIAHNGLDKRVRYTSKEARDFANSIVALLGIDVD